MPFREDGDLTLGPRLMARWPAPRWHPRRLDVIIREVLESQCEATVV